MDYYQKIMAAEIKRLKEERVVPNIPIIVEQTEEDQNTYRGGVESYRGDKTGELKKLRVEIPFESSSGFGGKVDKLLTVYHELGHIYHGHFNDNKNTHVEEMEADIFSGHTMLEKHSVNEDEADRIKDWLRTRVDSHIIKAVENRELHPIFIPFENIKEGMCKNPYFVARLYYYRDLTAIPLIEFSSTKLAAQIKKKKGEALSFFEQTVLAIHNIFSTFVFGNVKST